MNDYQLLREIENLQRIAKQTNKKPIKKNNYKGYIIGILIVGGVIVLVYYINRDITDLIGLSILIAMEHGISSKIKAIMNRLGVL